MECLCLGSTEPPALHTAAPCQQGRGQQQGDSRHGGKMGRECVRITVKASWWDEAQGRE